MNNYYTALGTAAEVPQSHQEEGGSLSPNIWTIGFSIVNLLILFLMLRWVYINYFTSILTARTEKIKKNITDAQKSREDAEKLKGEYKEQLEKLKEEANTIINNAHQKAQAEAEDLIKKTKEEAEMILQKAREQGQREVEKALEEVKNQVANLALQAATKVIEKNMDNEENRKLVQKFIDEVGAA